MTIGARVTSVVDGDTIRVRSLGPRRRSYTVRLVGIDAPEAGRRGVAGECGGLEAVSSVYALAFSDPSDTNSDGFLDRGGGQGRKVTVTTDPAQPSFDRRRRLLAYVTPRGRKMLQLALLEAGWARVSLVRGKALQYLRSFRRSSARARHAPRGMFDACGGNFHKRAPARAPKRNEACGPITLASARTTGRLVAVRGVTCTAARRVAAAYAEKGRAPKGWRCFRARNGPTRLFSCGKGGLVGDVRHWPAALEVQAVGSSPSPASTAAAVSGKPTATTGSASAVTSFSATLGGTVNPNGANTSFYFEYGTTADYGTATPEQSAGDVKAGVAVSAELRGLRAATSYHYRLVARNGHGIAYGGDAAFTTTAAAGYQNPVFSRFPDPMVLDNNRSRGDYYAYATGNNFPNVRSADLVHWQAAGSAFTSRPSWVVQSGDYHPWAPSVLQLDTPCPEENAGPCYVMYYTGLGAGITPAANCVAVATATRPGGPFRDLGRLEDLNRSRDQSGRPIGCGDDRGYGNIDPAPFVDSDGQAYLYVSTDFRCAAPAPQSTCPLAPTISVIPLTADRLHAAGPRQELFTGTDNWEQAGGVKKVENPWMERRGSTYYLLYSGGDWQVAYGMGYATGPSPTGAFDKAAANPILTPTADVRGPGGGSATTGPQGGPWLVYHGFQIGTDTRQLRIDPVSWSADVTLSINGPTSTPQSPLP
ncbi:MAG: family 43 glycosylhydrolase [Nocardioidaceae bacterium]